PRSTTSPLLSPFCGRAVPAPPRTRACRPRTQALAPRVAGHTPVVRGRESVGGVVPLGGDLPPRLFRRVRRRVPCRVGTGLERSVGDVDARIALRPAGF